MKRALLLAWLLPATVLAQADHAAEEFRALDFNGDRRISLAEAAGHGDIVVRFDRADRNGDGKLTRVEFRRLKKLKLPRSWLAARS